MEPSLSSDKTLSFFAGLPQLALPVIADDLRGLTKLALQDGRGLILNNVLQLLQRRGWAIHPCEWLPTEFHNEIPHFYWPWFHWVNNKKENKNLILNFDEPLCEQNWDRFVPLIREKMFLQMRVRDPAKARSLLESKMLRVRSNWQYEALLKGIGINFSDDDLPFLQKIANKNGKNQLVQIARLLIRGLGSQNNDQANSKGMEDLARFFQKSSEKFGQSEFLHGDTESSESGQNKLKLVPFKTFKQRQDFSNLIGFRPSEGLTWREVAAALGLSELECISAWPWGEDEEFDYMVAVNIKNFASDEIFLALSDILLEQKPYLYPVTLGIASRLPQQVRFKHAHLMLVQEWDFCQVCHLAGFEFEIDAVVAYKSALGLIEQLSKDIKQKKDIFALESGIYYSLLALCSGASRELALAMLDKFKELKIQNTAPDLYALLELNAALPYSGVKP